MMEIENKQREIDELKTQLSKGRPAFQSSIEDSEVRQVGCTKQAEVIPEYTGQVVNSTQSFGQPAQVSSLNQAVQNESVFRSFEKLPAAEAQVVQEAKQATRETANFGATKAEPRFDLNEEEEPVRMMSH
jgi:hypothetical protein